MSPTPRVSVVIPVFNREKIIERAVSSVLSQTYSNYEVIVVDDGSTDGTPEVLRAFGTLLRVVSQPNRGPYAARNVGIGHARGEYIAFLDSDDTWFPTRLELQVPLLDADLDLGLVFGNGEIIDEQRPERRRTFFARPGKPARGWVFPQLTQYNFIPQSSVLVRKRCFEELGGFLEVPLGADYHKWLQITLRYRLDFVDEIIITYRLHQTNITRDRITQYLYLQRVFDALIASVVDPKATGILRRRRLELEYETGLVCLREGMRSLIGVLVGSRQEATLSHRLHCFARVLMRQAGVAVNRLAQQLSVR